MLKSDILKSLTTLFSIKCEAYSFFSKKDIFLYESKTVWFHYMGKEKYTAYDEG